MADYIIDIVLLLYLCIREYWYQKQLNNMLDRFMAKSLSEIKTIKYKYDEDDNEYRTLTDEEEAEIEKERMNGR